MMELEALQEIDSEVRALGAQIVALTPELERYARNVHKKLNLSFDILTDPNRRVPIVPDIRHSILIDVVPARILPLISSGSGLAQWWAADVTENRSTGNVELGFFKRATVYVLEPLRDAAPGEVAWLCRSGKEWKGTKLLFQLTPRDNGTLVKFTHAACSSETDYFVSCNTTWGELMFRLKAAAEGKTPGPLFSATALAY